MFFNNLPLRFKLGLIPVFLSFSFVSVLLLFSTDRNSKKLMLKLSMLPERQRMLSQKLHFLQNELSAASKDWRKSLQTPLNCVISHFRYWSPEVLP